MNKFKSYVPVTLLLIVIAAAAYSVGNKGLPGSVSQNSEQPSGLNQGISFDQARQNILASIKTMDANVDSVQIEETPLSGIYWVLLPGNEAIVMSGDGRFYLGRGLSEFKDGTLGAVTSELVEAAKADAQKEVRDVFGSSDSGQLIFPAEGDKKGEIFVFTDVNCGYCRKFHKDVPVLNQSGIEVRYFAGPFFSKDREILERIWCSEDPLLAMTEAKAGEKLSDVKVTETCQNTVTAHIALGEKLGIRGTPAIFTADGQQIGGYLPPEQLATRFSQ